MKKIYVLSYILLFLLCPIMDIDAQINSGYTESEKLYLHTDRDVFIQKDTIRIKGYLQNTSYTNRKEVSRYIYAELFGDTLIKRVKIRNNGNGFSGYIPISNSVSPGTYILRAYTRNMQNFPENYMFVKPIMVVGKSIPGNNSSFTGKSSESNKTEEFDLQFLPESGRYLSGRSARVAFKAIGADGLSDEVDIKLYNTKDSLIGEYKSIHKGMGFINLYKVDPNGYKAVATTKEGYTKSFPLPKPFTQGATIALNNSGEKVIVKSCITKEIDSCSLIIRNGSEILYSVPVKDETISIFLTKFLAAGVTSAEIHSVSGDILAERLFYVRDDSLPILTINCNKSKYQTRDRVELTYNLKDSTGKPLMGEFSVSVIDKSLETEKFDKITIVEYFNLISELKGYVEDPEYYFKDRDKNRDRDLDILMMTQGWRFHTYSTNCLTREYGQTISGSTSGLLNKKSKKSNLMLYAPSINLFQAYQLDKQNNFLIENLDFPEGTKFLFGVSGKHGGQLYGIHIDGEVFPEIKREVNPLFGKEEEVRVSLISKGLISPADMEIQIEGLVVEAQAKERYKPKYNPSPFMHTFTRHQIREREELSNFDEMPLTSYICSTFPNLYKENGVIASGRATNFNGPQRPLLYVDGLLWSSTKQLDDYGYLVMDIENVAFLKGLEGSAFNTTDGVILITTRKGEGAKNYKASNVVNITPLGYQKELLFYSPKYETPEKFNTTNKDFRNTIYWAPFVQTNQDGEAKIVFYTNDRISDLLISAQGVTIDGKPINVERMIRVSGIANQASRQP